MVLFTALAVVFACGCTKPDEPNNGGGGGNNGGGNGGGNSVGGHYNGNYEFVDLGLPSGTLWATFNVGAAKPEDYGDYFAWGETTPKTTYGWSTYKYCKGEEEQLTKYCDDANYGYNGYTDTLTVLLPEDDAATVKWGAGWRMPTAAQWIELRDNTNCTADTLNGVNGHRLTASNGNSLFLPAAGYYAGENTNGTFVGKAGHYWSGSLGWSKPYNATNYDARSYLGGLGGISDSFRSSGGSIRPVRSR